MEHPKVTVIIPTKHHFDLVVNAVNQLCIKTLYPNYNIIIMYTGDSPEILSKLRKWEKETNWPVQIFEYSKEFNFAEVNNTAVEKYVDKDTEYILFLNDDCEPVNDVISILSNFYSSNKNVGTVAAQLRNKDERIQGMGYKISEYENGVLDLQQNAVQQMDTLFYSRHIEVAANSAICMLTSKSLFETLGGFSSIYIEDYSDVEYSLKCILEGKKNYCLGYAITIHYGWQTRGVTQEVRQRAAYDHQTHLYPFIDFYKKELRELGAFHFKDRRMLKKDWCLGVSDRVESNFAGGEIFRDPFVAENLQLQFDFEKRYDLKSDEGKLHVLMFGHKDGCGWARIDNPAYMLNKCTKDIVAFPTSVLTPELINWAHIFVWQVPTPARMKDVRDFLNKHGIPQIFEIDDDYIHLDKFNLARSIVDPDSVLDWVGNTTAFTTTRDVLGKFYQKRVPESKYVVAPNCINFDKFPETTYVTDDNHIRLGWMGGCTHYIDLERVAPVLRKLKEKYKDRLEICLFGWDGKLKPPFFAPKSVLGDLQVTHTNFVDVYKYYNKLAELKFDICFIPLADIPFNNIGKSPIKYLEASAARVPCVVSNSPVFSFIEDGVTGLKVDDLEGWENCLTKLIEDKNLRNTLSNNGYELVFNNYNLEKEIGIWARAYREVALTKYRCVKDE